jgi:hypothetical protein
MLSFRPGWGIVGKQPNAEYLFYSRYKNGTGYMQQASTYPDNIQLKNLKWEQKMTYNVGVDFGFFDDKLNGNVEQALNDARKKFEVGFGVGAGIELVSHIQISVQWFMNFGKLYDSDKLANTNLSSLTNLRNYQGVKITLGLFF